MKQLRVCVMVALAVVFLAGNVSARDFYGVSFPETKVIAGKTLTLNGTAVRKALGFIKVFAGGLYLEEPTSDGETAITSEQVKYFYLEYLTDKATKEKLQDGFKKEMAKTNPADRVAAQAGNIDTYASWLDQDMSPGATSESIYVPGKGLTLILNGVEKGTIMDPVFIEMYYRYSLGEKAMKKLRNGYLGQ